MNRVQQVVILMALAAVLLLPQSASAQQGGLPDLPGILDKDPRPNGCVSCHTGAGGNFPLKLNAVVGAIANHPKVDALVKNAPTDCGMCHKAGTKAGALSLVVHKAHFAKKAESRFVRFFGGACLNCHAVDPATGAAGVKSGPKNW